jgi:hypothetical protein
LRFAALHAHPLLNDHFRKTRLPFLVVGFVHIKPQSRAAMLLVDFTKSFYQVTDHLGVRNPINVDVYTTVLERTDLEGAAVAEENSLVTQ